MQRAYGKPGAKSALYYCLVYQLAVSSVGNGVGNVNEVTLCRARLVLTWVTANMLSWYVINHSGQLSLLPSAGRETSTGQGTLAVLCG